MLNESKPMKIATGKKSNIIHMKNEKIKVKMVNAFAARWINSSKSRHLPQLIYDYAISIAYHTYAMNIEAKTNRKKNLNRDISENREFKTARK